MATMGMNTRPDEIYMTTFPIFNNIQKIQHSHFFWAAKICAVNSSPATAASKKGARAGGKTSQILCRLLKNNPQSGTKTKSDNTYKNLCLFVRNVVNNWFLSFFCLSPGRVQLYSPYTLIPNDTGCNNIFVYSLFCKNIKKSSPTYTKPIQ